MKELKRKKLHVIECRPCVRQPSEHFILIIAFPLPLRLGYTRARCYTGCCEDGLPSNEFCARLEGHPSSLPVRSALCVWTRRSPDLLGVISASASPSFSPGPYPTFLQSLSDMGGKTADCVPKTCQHNCSVSENTDHHSKNRLA